MDADLRRPRMHSVFGLSRTSGLTEVLQNEATLEEGLRPTSVEELHVMEARSGRRRRDPGRAGRRVLVVIRAGQTERQSAHYTYYYDYYTEAAD